ncbi:hypothetical protein Ais01nite_23430 [Asanoa ishikariensis]|uniref:Uncharacterized protein n=1 Tax=Asanoa ishikariensis TaxID=137265 RepID=A0A1H3R966_9ACTN|nr:hypothetical protein [Asanoa ishikariensis]GIF64308.1 hypothetical protein Ais01nite_23430 [Asanoa ishikariensis]SDZ21788.1 hypothetical protein SAMN05421684_3571 [Asanoa ishikariensis]
MTFLKKLRVLAGVGAVAVYAWGLLHVGYAVMRAEDGGTGASPIEPCRAAGPGLASQVDGYAVGFLPLRFECRLSGGGAFTAPSVPGYVNPAAAVLALTAAGSAIVAYTFGRGK